MSNHEAEVLRGDRFEFGRNWARFLRKVSPERIQIAEQSLRDMLRCSNLHGKTFLDAGSGSGLSSLAARNLGAFVHSFDYDAQSVAATTAIREKYGPEDEDNDWIVEKGSVLDIHYLKSLGEFDIVYSWGVLHHTGKMWDAIDNVIRNVAPGGSLLIAIYNDEGFKTRVWRRLKQVYCSGLLGKSLIIALFVPYFALRLVLDSILARKNLFTEYKRKRGMSVWHDWIDWLGGLPFEAATAAEIFEYVHERGFDLANLRTTNGRGNNQFVFVRKSGASG